MQWMTALDREEDRRWRTTPSWIDVSIDQDRLRETSGLTADQARARLEKLLQARYPEARFDIRTHNGRLSVCHDVNTDARVPHCYDVSAAALSALGDPR